MMTELKGIRIPAWYNGIGVHDTCGCNAGVMSYAEALAYGRDLLDHGVTFYKLLVAGTNKVQMARGLVDAGLVVAVRFYVERPWGRPPQSWVIPADQVQPYADVGVQLFELGWNEANIAGEWPDDDIPPQAWAIADAVIAAWKVGLAGAGTIPGVKLLFPSMTPGGNVDHRWVYNEIVAKLWAQGLIGTVEHLAVHPRPHNNPPDTTWTDTNTVTFDEWRWIRDKFNNGAYLWATEHGYSLRDDQNHEYPQIDLQMWTDYNWELFVRMNPAHPKAIEPQLAGFAYWIIQDFGAFNSWEKDCLIGSSVPEMPNPSPLWIRMGERVTELEFNRYGSEPPVPPAMPGATDLRATLPRNGDYPQRTLDQLEQIVIHHSGPPGWLQGVKADEYARRIAVYHIGHNGWPGIGYAFVIGPQGMICQCTNLTDIGNHVGGFNTASVGICLLGDYRVDKNVRPPGEQIDAARAVIDWLRGQYVFQFGLPYVGHKDLNPGDACPGDTWDIWKGELEPPEPPEERLIILDITGTQRDWAWLVANYGAVEILPADGYQVIQLTEVEGIMGFTCTLLNEAGGPVAGQQVAYAWPDGEQVEITNSFGVAEHIAGAGEGYWLPGPGPISWYVVGAESERVTGLGWLNGTNHRHLQVTMQWDGEPEPPPPDDWQADTTARLERIEQLLLHIHAEHVFQPDNS